MENPTNNPPAFTSPTTFTYQENSPSLLAANIQATDADGDTLTYSISGGADAALFTIDANSGGLTFKAAPDYETPNDNGGDHTYNLTVQVSDGTDATTQDISITLANDASDDPSVELPIDFFLLGGRVEQGQGAGIAAGTFSGGWVDFSTGNQPLVVDPNLLGKLKWKTDIGIPSQCAPSMSPDGILYIMAEGQSMVAVDSKTGSIKWIQQSEGADDFYASAVVGFDGNIYLGYGYITSHDGQTGETVWNNQVWSNTSASPALGQDGKLYASRSSGSILSLDLADGSKNWEWWDKNSNFFEGIPAISMGDDGTLYFSGRDGNDYTFYAIDSKSGTQKWEFSPEQTISTAPAIGDDGTIYFGTWEGVFYALDGRTGNKLWDFKGNKGIRTSPVIGTDGKVFYCSDENLFYALDGRTGNKVWEYTAPTKLRLSPTITADGTIIVSCVNGSVNGNLIALDAGTGRLKWSYTATGEYSNSTPLVTEDGTIYLITSSADRTKYLHAIQGSSGPADSAWPMFQQNTRRTGRRDSQPGTLELVSGEGDSGNTAFTIQNCQLLTSASFTDQSQAPYSIRVKATTGSRSVEKVFTIQIGEPTTNTPPIITSSASFTYQENLRSMAVGRVQATDADKDKVT